MFDVIRGESYNFETRSINFLDLKIWMDEEGYIQTTLFEKPCRVVSYLLPSSSHPGFICRNIRYNLAYSWGGLNPPKRGWTKTWTSCFRSW